MNHRKLLFNMIGLIFLGYTPAFAQQGFSHRVTDCVPVKPFAEVNVRTLPDDWSFSLEVKEAKKFPHPGGYDPALKQQLDAQRKQRLQAARYKMSSANAVVSNPSVQSSFSANTANGTPNDNSMAISNSGKIVSVANTNVRVYDESGVSQMPYRSLFGFTGNQLGNLNRTYDPRAIYDPISDRFIVVFLQGDSSNDSRIIIGFSQTPDPAGIWKWYALQGNRWGNGTWLDYPIVCISEKDLFITGNLLKDGKGWKDGFTQSIIWQVKKQDGYDGVPITNRYYDSITYNGKPIWNICSAQGGSKPYGPETFFISLRPGDAKNDTVFLHTVSNTLESNKATFSTRLLKSNITYGVPPSALQPSGQYLQTNDARALSATIEGGVIYFAGNTIDTITFSPGVYFGKIKGLWSPSPTVSAQILSSDTLDFGYPSVAYVGGGAGDASLLINCSHVSASTFPGASVFFVDRFGAVSAPIRARNGNGSINVIADTNERWGDYSGLQYKYNEKGVCWLSGSYGESSGQHPTIVAKIKNTDPQLSVKEGVKLEQVILYPNPAFEAVHLTMHIPETATYSFDLYDLNGQVVKSLKQLEVAAGEYQISFDISGLAAGTYMIKASDNAGKQITRQLVVAH